MNVVGTKIEPIEGPWALPSGWVWAKLGDFPMGGGGSVTPNREPDTPFVLYSVPSFSSGRPERVRGAVVESGKQLVATNSLLVCKLNPRINRVWKVGTHRADEGRIIASTEWIVVLHVDSIEPDYLRHFLSTERTRQYLAANVSGVGGSLMRVNAATVGEIVFPLPPLPEQRRIVERIDELFSEIAEGEAALGEARKGLDLFRRALLKAAVIGELTRDWRAVNKPTETDASIVAELRLKRQDSPWELRPDLPELPNTWTWCSVSEAGEVQLGRQRVRQHHDGDHMRPYLRVANVLENKLDLSDVKMMNFTPEEFKTFALQPGDLLLNEGQAPDLLGRPAIYRGEIEGCCFQKTLLRFRAHPWTLPEFALLVFRHYMHSGRFKKESRITTNIGHLTQVRFVVMEFPLPPLDEQQVIVDLFSQSLDEAETELRNIPDASQLKQSILKSVFEGRLVPQDPNDEPASALLARLAPSFRAPRSRAS